MDAWEELKKIIKIYNQITGGPSQPLCERLLKLPDFIDDIKAGRDPSEEMAHLAHLLAHEIAQGVHMRLSQMVNKHPGLKDTATNVGATLQWARLSSLNDATASVQRMYAIRAILFEAELGLRRLQDLTGQDYPTVII